MNPPKKRPAELHATIDVLREKITTLVFKAPDKAAIILTDWVHEREKKKKAA